ncbi:MAG: VanR-ABDEGLN family DNA-binding response regulator [Lachnospiraceae bacterium]|jgi:two-component system response regulator VanR|nr:VanR-ABDEGLN family DNA-binding response regulator [Lachnospiraceae bacterium]
MNDKILVVEDEKDIADLLEVYLSNEGYFVLKAENGSDAFNYIKNEDVSLVILDIMLPDTDGLTLCRQIREKYLFPVIMLTARNSDMDKINGLSMGADDYMTKPFNPLEVVARVKTQLRRYKRYNTAEVETIPEYDKNGLYVCKDTHKCELYGKELSLTPIEFDILWYLCERKGIVVSSEELFENVWKEKYFSNSNNTVMAHIARLREKLGDEPRKPKFVKTVWGVGYKIEG